MAQYVVEPTARIVGWLEATDDPDRREALLTWVATVAIRPTAFVSRAYHNIGRGRTVYYVDLPKACTRVSWVVFETPVRCVRIVDIDDAAYGT